MSAASSHPAKRKSQLPRAAAIVALLAVSLLAWRPLAEWQQRQFAVKLAQRATESETPAQVQKAVDELWPLGLPATAPLAQMAAMQRAELAAAAQQGLANQLAAWEIELEAGGNTPAFAAKVAELSGLIAANAEQMDAAGQLWAKKLSRRMANDCAILPAAEAWEILRACDRVSSLRTAYVVGEVATTRALPEARPLIPPVTAGTEGPPPVQPPPEMQPAMPLTSSSGAELASPPSPTSELAVIMSPPMAAIAPIPGPPAPVAKGPAENPLRPDASGGVSAEPLETQSPPSAVAASGINGAVTARPEPVEVPSPLDMRRLRQQLRPQSDAQLMTLVETGPRFEAAAAQEVLRIRGYTAELLQRTRELRQLPANERRAALDRASELAPAEARSLLRWFLADADAEVRLQALSLLATTGDPQLEELARQRAVDDDDPRVADLATKLLQSR